MQLMISRGADPKAATRKGETALQLALQNNAEAAAKLLLAGTGVRYTEKFVDNRFKESSQAFQDGDLARAYDILRKLVQDDPANSKYNFALGMTCMSLGDRTRAQMAFERVLQAEPGNMRARAELGRTYLETAQYALAEREFQSILASPNLNPEVREKVERHLKAAQKGMKLVSFSGRLDIGWFKDSNVNIGPDSEVIGIAPIIFGSQVIDTLDVGERSLPFDTTGIFSSLVLSGQTDPGQPGKWTANVDAMIYQNWLDEMEQNETLYGVVSLSGRRIGRKTMAQVPFRFSHITIGHNPLVKQYAIAPSIICTAGGDSTKFFTTSAQVESRDYDRLDARDSVYMAVGETMRCLFGAAKHSVSMGVTFFKDNTDAAVYEQEGRTWSMGFDFRLPAMSRLYMMAKRSASDYAEKETLMPDLRSDTQEQLTLGVSKLFMNRMGLDINYQRTSNKSTFGLYQYDRDVTTVSTFVTF